MRQEEKLKKQLEHLQRMKESLGGSGKYLFKNISNSDWYPPKPTLDRKNHIRPNEEFLGDSYFLRQPGITLLKDLTMNEELITEQPPIVTSEGNKKPQTMESKQESDKEVLLTERPLDGVKVIHD